MDAPKGVFFYAPWVSDIGPTKATLRLELMSNVVIHRILVDHTFVGVPKPKLLDEVCARSRRLNYSAL
jgi:hypothetical protein